MYCIVYLRRKWAINQNNALNFMIIIQFSFKKIDTPQCGLINKTQVSVQQQTFKKQRQLLNITNLSGGFVI